MNGSAEECITTAARITVVFATAYSFTFVNVLLTKKRLLKEAKAAKKRFDRYNSPQMRTADRLQANLLEWSPVFLGLLWSLAATGKLNNKTSVVAAWTYVGLRALYIVLVLRHGVSSDGMNKALWISTFPGYFCLSVLWMQALVSLFL